MFTLYVKLSSFASVLLNVSRISCIFSCVFLSILSGIGLVDVPILNGNGTKIGRIFLCTSRNEVRQTVDPCTAAVARNEALRRKKVRVQRCISGEMLYDVLRR